MLRSCGVPAALPQHLLPGEVRRGPGGGQSGGGRGTGTAPSFLAPLRRRNPRREEPVRVCAGKRLASGLGGLRPTLRRGTVAGHPAWPAPQPRRRRLASPPCPPRLRRPGPQGRRLGGPHQSVPTPALTALVSDLGARSLLCAQDLDGYPQISRKPRTDAGAPAQDQFQTP